jgi:hypothetical protein
MFNNGKVIDTCYEIEREEAGWQVFSYVQYETGRRIRNWVGTGPTKEEAYTLLNKLRAKVG